MSTTTKTLSKNYRRKIASLSRRDNETLSEKKIIPAHEKLKVIENQKQNIDWFTCVGVIEEKKKKLNWEAETGFTIPLPKNQE